MVWDVTGAESFGPGGSYEHFTGRDCTMALVHMQLGSSWVNRMDGWKDLSEKQRAGLDSWIKYFDEKYIRAGVVLEWLREGDYEAMQRRFLEENAKRPHVVVHPSGLQHELLQPGQGQPPDSGKGSVEILYSGHRIDGIPFALPRQLIVSLPSIAKNFPGLAEALRHMSVGERRLLYVPAQLAFTLAIGYPDDVLWPGSTLVVDVKVLKIMKDRNISSGRRGFYGAAQ